MSKKKGERNVGLVGGLTADNVEALRDARLISDATGLASIAMVRCVLCHFHRGTDVSGRDITNCTGVDANAYNLLAKLESQRQVTESRRGLTPGAMSDNIYYEPLAQEVSYLGRAIPIPERCAEIGKIGLSG